MKLHPQVASILRETVGETRLAVKAYAMNSTGARGFFPERLHPNLSIEFVAVGPGKHIELTAGRTTHVQYNGEHFGGVANQSEYATKKRCVIVSAIGYNNGGRLVAVALDHIAKNGGRLMGEGYFSWQGQNASLGPEKAVQNFFTKMNALFGVPGLRIPDAKQDAAIYMAAGIGKGEQEAKEDLPAIIKGQPGLLPAVKLLLSAGADLESPVGIDTALTKVPTDLNHQHLIQKALDDLKDAEILDYDVHYNNTGGISGVTIMRLKEGIALDRKVAIIESMKNSNGLKGRKVSTNLGNGYEIVAEGTGLTFLTIENTDGTGTVNVSDGTISRFVGEHAKGKLTETVLNLVKKIKNSSIQECSNEALGLVNG